MSHVLRLEAIGDGLWPAGPPVLIGKKPSTGWCAKVAIDCGQVEREFLKPMMDYSQGNGRGSRGVYKTYVLQSGLYEVFEKTSWTKSRRYFIGVRGETVEEFDTARDAEDWGETWQK